MAATCRQQIYVLNTAVRRQAGRFKYNDPGPYLAAAAALASDGVCARCLLRLVGHANLDDYVLPSPSRAEVLDLLGRGAAASDPKSRATAPVGSPVQQPGSASQPEAAAATTGPLDPPCPACFGLLQTLLEETPRVRQGHDVADTATLSHQPHQEVKPTAAAASGVRVEAGTPAGAADGSVDLAWLRIQQKALPGAVGCHTGPTAGHERLPGFISAGGLAAAVQRQVENGTPESAALVAAAAAAESATAAAAVAGVPPSTAAAEAGRDSSADLVMSEATSAEGSDAATAVHASGTGPGANTAAADGSEPSPPEPTAIDALPSSFELRPEDMGSPLPFKSFSLEVTALPAAWALRDAAMFAWTVSYYESKKAPYTGWRTSDIVPLPNVLRRALPVVLSRALGVPAAAPRAANVAVTVAVLDGEDGLTDLRVLAEDQAARQPRRQPNPAYHQRFNKRQRGAGGPHQRGNVGGEQAEGPYAEVTQKGFEERARRMGWEQVIAAAVNMPRHVVERLFPWPPRSPEQRQLLPPPQQTQQPQPHEGQQQPPQPAQQRQQQPEEQQQAGQQEQQQQRQEKLEEQGRQQPPPTEGADGESVATAATERSGVAMAAAAAATERLEVTAEAAAAVEAEGAAEAAGSRAGVSKLPCTVHLKALHAPLLLAGRYCKLRRHMPQCPWFVLATGARIGGVSVQESIERFVLPLYGTATAKMITGGREDADVRMLGPGRPFVLEIQAPLRDHPTAEALRRTEDRMRNSKCGVAVRCLKPCGPSALEAIKSAEESKEKTYRALCWAAEAPTSADLAGLVALGRVEAQQDTPVRVLHRRAAKIRPKWIKIESATSVPDKPHYFVLQMRTQAGTYVKEFCHGDFGRCQPCVGELLGRIRATASAGAAADEVTANGTATSASAASATAAEAKPAVANGGRASAKGRAVAATANGHSAKGPKAAAGAKDGGGNIDSCYVHVEIVQLDVLDVHLEEWP